MAAGAQMVVGGLVRGCVECGLIDEFRARCAVGGEVRGITFFSFSDGFCVFVFVEMTSVLLFFFR